MPHSNSSNAETEPLASGPSPLMQVAEFWSWLPAFRVVAETLHLPTASRQLAVSASALSRAVRLLEGNLGVELFLRIGARLELTQNGQALLAAVRDGMRGIHDGMLAARSETMTGVVRVACTGAITTVAVVPALLELRRNHPGLRGVIVSEQIESIPNELLAGQIDLAMTNSPVRSTELESVEVGALSHGVYCGPDHELRDAKEPLEPADLASYEFVAPGVDANGHSLDAWPDSIERRIGLQVDQMRIGAEVCAHGNMLAVLPDRLVPRLALPLQRLNVDAMPTTTVFGIVRSSLGSPSRARITLDAVVELMGGA